jgi:hypothetical protein
VRRENSATAATDDTRYINNQAQLVVSMMEGVSMDRWSFPKAKESSSCYENALRFFVIF